MGTIRGGTSIYGTLHTIDVDGLHLTTIQGNDMVIDADEPTRALLADRIGDEIGLRGIATYRFHDMIIVGFVIEEVLPYHKVPLSEALASLREAIGDAYEWVETETDIDDYVKWIRGTDDERINDRFDEMFRNKNSPGT